MRIIWHYTAKCHPILGLNALHTYIFKFLKDPGGPAASGVYCNFFVEVLSWSLLELLSSDHQSGCPFKFLLSANNQQADGNQRLLSSAYHHTP